MGSFARVNRLDKLCFGWYKISSIPENIDGGNFDKISGNTYVDVDPSWDGGSFDDYASGDEYDGSSFVATDYYHHLFNLRSQTINADDIRITGIKVTAKSESSQTAESVMKGTDGYVLEVSGNPLIQTGAVEAVAAYVYAKLGNMVFRPLSISGQSDPSIEAGDVAMVTDRKNRTYNTVITNNTFVLCGDQKVECSAETPTEKNYTRFGPGTKLMSKAKEQTDGQLSAYDIAVQNMNQLAANTFGFYATTVKQADGSILAYRHDKPKLAESKIVYKSGIDGFWVTSDYQGNDADTTWKAGFDSSGDAVMNVLSVIGINFSWAHGGILTLGGSGNGNGILQLLDSNDQVIALLNSSGVELTGQLINRKGQEWVKILDSILSAGYGTAVDGRLDLSAQYGDGTRKTVLESLTSDLVLKSASGKILTGDGRVLIGTDVSGVYISEISYMDDVETGERSIIFTFSDGTVKTLV